MTVMFQHGRRAHKLDPTPSRQAEEQRVLDKQWFEDHPDRVLYLRKARAFERAAQIAAGSQKFENAVIVLKITEQVRIRVFMSAINKPINKTLSEHIEALNYEELLVDMLSRMPAGMGDFPDALAMFRDMRARGPALDKAFIEAEQRREAKK